MVGMHTRTCGCELVRAAVQAERLRGGRAAVASGEAALRQAVGPKGRRLALKKACFFGLFEKSRINFLGVLRGF